MQFRTSLLLFGIVAVTSARLHFDSRSDVGIQERQQSCQSEVDALARTIESCGRAIASPNPDGPIRGFVGCICFDETNEIVAGALNCAASANTDTVLDPQTAYNRYVDACRSNGLEVEELTIQGGDGDDAPGLGVSAIGLVSGAAAVVLRASDTQC